MMSLVSSQHLWAGPGQDPAAMRVTLEGSVSRARWPWVGLGVAAALLAAFLSAGCNHSEPKAKGGKAVEVVATTPITDEVTDYQDFTGRLSAEKSVDMRARVSGYVNEVPFKEGDRVNAGDLLFHID